MGAGKSTLGKSIAAKLSWPFLDTDAEIEKKIGINIVDIFTKYGEHYFRTLESNLIKNLPLEPTVISCGGGIPCYCDNIINLKKSGKVIFLNTDFDTIYSRISISNSRPLIQLKSKEEIKNLYTIRHMYYQLSDMQIDNSLSLDKLINRLSL